MPGWSRVGSLTSAPEVGWDRSGGQIRPVLSAARRPSYAVAMAMGNRPGVETAQAPVAALDVALLAQQLAAALLRVPFRRPLRQGGSNPAANLGICVTREVIRSFMGYTSSLPIPEFRSVELVLDDICKVIMPPVVRSLDVQGHPAELGGVPGILYRPRRREPVGVDPLPARRRLHRHLAPDVRLLHRPGVQGDRLRRLRGRLPPGARVPLPGRRRGRHRRLRGPARPRRAQRAALPGRRLGRRRAGQQHAAVLRRAASKPIRPAGLILFSPEVDLRLDEPSVTENAHLDILPWNIPTASYLHGEDASSASISPLTADLDGFPPTFVAWGGDEMFRDPIRRYAERLRAAGVPTHAHEFEGMFHVFQILMPWAEKSRAAFAHLQTFVQKLVADAPAFDPAVLRDLPVPVPALRRLTSPRPGLGWSRRRPQLESLIPLLLGIGGEQTAHPLRGDLRRAGHRRPGLQPPAVADHPGHPPARADAAHLGVGRLLAADRLPARARPSPRRCWAGWATPSARRRSSSACSSP